MTEVENENLGMMGYFPWMTSTPRADWLPGDTRYHVVGSYPDADVFYQTWDIDYVANKKNMTANDMGDGWKAFSGSEYNNTYSAWKAFQTSESLSIADCWLGKGIPTEDKPEFLGLLMGEERHLVTKVKLIPRDTTYPLPQEAILWGSTDGVNWTELRERMAVGADGIIEVPEDKQHLVSAVRLDMYKNQAGIRRMIIYAKGIRPPSVSKDMETGQAIPGMFEWHLRTGPAAKARMMRSAPLITYR